MSPGIPPDLEEQAARRLGRFLGPTHHLVERMSAIRWLSRLGQAAEQEDVIAVRTIEEAHRAHEQFRPVAEAVWQAVEEIGRVAGRQEVMEAAEEYWIARFAPDEEMFPYETLGAQIHTDLVGALRELMIEDVATIRFFRVAVDWYEEGHWRCGIASGGQAIVL